MAINRVVLTGRLGANPELRYTTNGVAVSTFRIAVDRRNKDDGPDWIQIVCFKGLAETVAKHLQKGRLVGVDGRLNTRTWEDSENRRHYAVEVIPNEVTFLDGRRGEEGDATVDPDDVPF